jgi:hypothetical protein
MNKLIQKYHFVLFFFLVLQVALHAQVMPRIYDLSHLQIIKNKIKVNDKEFQIAYQQLLVNADKALNYAPVSVMDKKEVPPSGNKHDYMSLAPYHWPNPNTKDGLPYIRKDGETNPEVKLYKDKKYLPELCSEVFNLSLASYYSEDAKYATHALKLIRVWFLDSLTKMNPNMNFSQAIKGENTGRGAGLIDGRHLIKIIEAIGILNQVHMIPIKDVEMMQGWFSSYLNWMQTSKNGQEEMNAPNNHGVWYDALRLSIALFTDQNELANKIVLNAQKRLESQLDSNMRFPLEMARTTSLHYSLFVVEAFMKIAKMGEFTKTELWNYSGKNGKSLKKSFNEIAPYLYQETKWDGQQIKPFDFSEGIEVLNFGQMQYSCEKCKNYLNQFYITNKSSLTMKLLF